jgi:hypothetical protein
LGQACAEAQVDDGLMTWRYSVQLRKRTLMLLIPQDPVFDEVCCDFELLLSELASDTVAAGTDAVAWRADTQVSLRALKAEIMQLLGRKPPTQPSSDTETL